MVNEEDIQILCLKLGNVCIGASLLFLENFLTEIFNDKFKHRNKIVLTPHQK